MADYISREAAVAIFRAKADMGVLTPAQTYFNRAADMIDLLPAADVEPVRHGRWKGESGLFQGECLVCGYMTFDKTADWARKYWKYCPNCGAKMKGGENNDD